MKRKIKFRVWLPHEEKMLDGDYIVPEGQRINEIFQGHEEFMQYTGLKDASGREIYEGDIVTDEEPGPEGHDTVYGFVIWEEAAARFSVQWCPKNWNPKKDPPSTLQSQAKNVYIVGNIYENADFLSAKKVIGVDECKKAIESAGAVINADVLVATLHYLEEYKRLKFEASWDSCPECMGR